MGASISSPTIFGSAHWKHSEIVALANGRKLRGKSFTFSEEELSQHLRKPKFHFKSAHEGGGVTINAFLNIPFGKPPVGELRFKKPQPAEPWALDHVLDCTKFGPRCPHEDMLTEVISGFFYPKNEDCLRLNVFAPAKSTSTEKLPVMVFIHGGGFVVHSAAHYGDIGICRNLCTKGVIVVTIQYRLGFFGFLCTGDEHAPGNMGLWDQALALCWVHDNIDAFGGDADNVTVFGQSAGAASTDFLALSPHSRDYFQKMIVMSGSASCTFALNEAKHVRDACTLFAEENGFKLDREASIDEQNWAIVEFFRKMPPHSLELSLVGKSGYSINRHGMIDLTPVIDGDFLPKPLHELRKEAPHKIIITGITEYEGLLFTAIAPRKNSLRSEAHKVIAKELNCHGISSTEMVNPRIKNLYFNNIDESNHSEMTMACVKAASDVLIVNGVWEFADEMTHLGHTVYLYSFEHFHMRTFGIAGFLFPFKGATHCSELPYIFHKGIIGSFHPSAEEMEISHRFTTFFINFAKFGNPNDDTKSIDNLNNSSLENYWQPLSENNRQQYFRIAATHEDSKMINSNFSGGRPLVWREIFATKITPQENLVNGKGSMRAEEEARIFDVPKKETGCI